MSKIMASFPDIHRDASRIGNKDSYSRILDHCMNQHLMTKGTTKPTTHLNHQRAYFNEYNGEKGNVNGKGGQSGYMLGQPGKGNYSAKGGKGGAV